MNLLSLVGPRLDNICYIKQNNTIYQVHFFQSKRGLTTTRTFCRVRLLNIAVLSDKCYVQRFYATCR
jgi:hypothetical protein